jgi:hypothetical protein
MRLPASALLRRSASTALSLTSARLRNSLRPAHITRTQLQTVLAVRCADRICSASDGARGSAIRDADSGCLICEIDGWPRERGRKRSVARVPCGATPPIGITKAESL